MALTTFSMIHLGHMSDLDPLEGNSTAENASDLAGTYFDASDPAIDHITTVTLDDANGDGVTQGDGFGAGETLTYDLGAGQVTTGLDFASNVTIDVTFYPGSGQANYTGLGGIIQTSAGDVFLVMIDDDYGLGANALDDVPILSVSVTSVQSSSQNQAATASDDQSFVTCFARGTQIFTQTGPVAIECLRVGDLLHTARNGLRPIRWIGKTRIPASRMTKNDKLRPVRITAGVLGQGRPARDLLVSRQHRMLVSCPIAQEMFDQPEVFISAIKLTALPGIFVDTSLSQVVYFHILLDEHEIIFAENAPTESFYAGTLALQALSNDAKNELRILFPQLGADGPLVQARRLCPNNKEQNQFVARCAQNNVSPLASLTGINLHNDAGLQLS